MRGERSKVEEVVAEGLGKILAGLAVGSPIDTKAPGRMESALEFYLPAVLRHDHEFWGNESLDGLNFVVARKIGPASAEFLGLAQLITSQKWVAMDLTLELRGPPWFVRRVRCKVGEPGGGVGGLATVVSGSPEIPALLAALPGRRDQIPWVFEVDVELPEPV